MNWWINANLNFEILKKKKIKIVLDKILCNTANNPAKTLEKKNKVYSF